MKFRLCSLYMLLFLLSGQSSAIIKTITTFDDGKEGQENKIEIWGDNHYLGSKEENRKQLKVFVESELLKNGPIYLSIESKFFDGVDVRTTNSLNYFRSLYQKLGWSYADTLFSLDQSPQAPSALTWIAWDLPLILMNIFNHEELPSFINLTVAQKQHIINNVHVTFVDPRLRISKDTVAPEQPEVLRDELLKNFNMANQSSPKKVAPILDRYVQEHSTDTPLDSPNSTNKAPQHASMFDIALISNLITTMYSNNTTTAKRIIILCGQWHVQHLDKLFPDLGFTNRIKRQLQTPVQDKAPLKTAAPTSARRKLDFLN
jgi:hypothetical protein